MENDVKKTRKLVFRNANIYYYVMGNRRKGTILMLHPAFADHTIFESQLDYFKDSYQVILIDMPGHGESQMNGSNVTLAQMPEIIDQLMSENDIADGHLLGVSLGSLVAQAFAVRYPHRVKSLIIVGGYSIRKVNEQVLKAQKREGLKWILYLLFSMEKFRSYVSSVSCHTDLGREKFARGMQYFKRRSFSAMAGMKSFFINQDNSMQNPLLIIVGEYDRKLAHDAAIELHEMEKHSRLVQLPEAGHCANADAPRTFNLVVDSFLAVRT